MEVDGRQVQADSPVCAECIGGDPILAERFARDGVEAQCLFCGELRQTITLEEVTDRVDDAFKKYVRPAEDTMRFDSDDDHGPYWAAGGRTPVELISDEILGCESDVADTIVELLARAHWREVTKGAWDYYDRNSEEFDIEIPQTDEYQVGWNDFVERVKHKSRFYNEDQQEYLHSTFGPLLRGELHGGRPPIITIGAADSQIKYLYRARVANTEPERRCILANPSRELAPPPPIFRTAGRMNAAGVRAFYGCTEPETAVAEVRTPVRGAAIVGKFELLQTLSILDLRILDKSAVTGLSYFDPQFVSKVAYGVFMRKIHQLIRTPVFPGAETFDYLPTQMFAEYLAHEGLDGVMFVSSLKHRPEPDDDEEENEQVANPDSGLNVVLFAASSLIVNDLTPPSREVLDVYESFVDDDELLVSVRKLPDAVVAAQEIEYPPWDDAAEPSMRLLEDEISIAKVREIRYDVRRRKATFSTREDGASPDDALPF